MTEATKGAAYVPGSDGISPMFADHLRSFAVALAKAAVADVPSMASEMLASIEDAQQKGALTKAAAVALRKHFTGLGGVSPIDATSVGQRQAIVAWLRKSPSEVAQRIAQGIENGEHLK